MSDNTGRKYHWWVNTPTMKTRDLVDVCQHCGLVSVTTPDSPRPTFRDSHGRALGLTFTPDCPRTPTY